MALGLLAAAPAAAQEVGPAFFASQEVVSESALEGNQRATDAMRRALRADGFTVRTKDIACAKERTRRFRCNIELADWRGVGDLRQTSGRRAALRYAVESR